MAAREVVSILFCAVGLVPLLAGTFSRRRRIPGPAAPLTAALFLWALGAFARLVDPHDLRGLVTMAQRFGDFAPVLLIMTLYGYMYEAALGRARQTKRHLAAALRALPAVVAGLNSEGHLAFCNRPREMARVLGIDEEEAARCIRTPVGEDQVDHDEWDDLVLGDCPCDVAAMLGLAPWPPPATTSVERAEGGGSDDGRAWIAVASPVASPLSDGSVAIVCLLDITELNRLRRQVRQLEKSEAVAALAAGVAHELNNQVMAILCHADHVSTAQPHEMAERFEQHAETIRQAAERVQRMLQHLLKLAAPTGEGPREALRIKEIVGDVVHLFRPSLPRGVRLAVQIEEDAPVVQADPDGVHQVLLNLLLNARDAVSEAGRISLRVGSANRALPSPGATRVRGRDVKCLAIDVMDDGPGMTASIAQRIFDPFFSTKTVEAGAGLGLSVSYGIVRSHGGDMIVDSSPGAGTRFTVYLPVEVAEEREEPEVVPSSCGAPVVLVVDDERALIDVMARSLRARGFDVMTALSGAEAMFLAQQAQRVDAMLIDLMLPDIEGIQLLDNLSGLYPGAAAVILTGYSSPFTHAEAARRGVRVLSKPVRMAELLSALEPVVGAAA
jgi:signal transduction histidine kinase